MTHDLCGCLETQGYYQLAQSLALGPVSVNPYLVRKSSFEQPLARMQEDSKTFHRNQAARGHDHQWLAQHGLGPELILVDRNAAFVHVAFGEINVGVMLGHEGKIEPGYRHE